MPPVGAFFAGLAGAGLAAGLAGTAAASTWLAGVTVGKFLTSTVGRLLVTVALSALQAAQMDKPTSQVAGLRTSQTMTGGTNPASFVIGAEYATDGQLVTPPMSHGSAGGLPNAYLNYVIELSDLPLSGLNMLVLDGELVELGTQAHADYGLPVLGRFADHAWVRFYDGTQTAADPMLMDRYGDYERPWGSDRIGAGIAYAVLTFRYNREIFVQFPRVRFVVGGIPLYDARKDSSVGGVGAHRWADPASWEPSSNTAVQIYNILRGIDLGDGHIWGGGAEAEDLPLDIWWAAMNACDVQIERADGSFENAYRSAFEIAVSDEPASVIDELLKACGGRMAEVGGAYKIRVGGTGLPVFYFTDDDVVVSETQSFTPFPTANSIYNGVHASYPDPDAAWQSREAPARYNLIYELEDGGQRRVADLRLPTAPYPDQVQRLQLSYLKNERRARQHSLTLGPDATQLEPLDVVGYSSGRNGYISKSFELTATTDPLITGNPTLGLRETDPGDYDWSPTFTLPSSAPASRKVPIPTLSVPGFNAFAFVQTDALEIERRVQIRIVWNADAIEAPGIRWEVRLRTTGQQVTQGSTSRMAAGEAFISEGLIPDTDYEVRAELVTSLPSVPTGWILVHTDDVRLTIADLSAEVFQAIDDDARATASSLIAAFELETIQPIADLIPPITADIARIDVEIGSIQADIPEILQDIGRIDIDLELKDVRQQSIFDTLDRIGQNLLWAMTKVSSTESTLRGAGIYEDPDEGTIRIAAFDGLQTDIAAKFSEVQISLDAQNAAISLTATQTWVNQQLAQATLDPSFTPLIDDLELQVATAQVDIDALEAAVTLKADVTTVDGLNVRLDSAKVDIDALQTAIVLKVETTDFTALETRVSSAEVQLGTLDAPSITQTVADVRYLQQGQTDADAATLAQLIQGYRDRKAVSQSLAYVQQDMRALVGEDREAIASLKVSFGAQIDSNVALIERETTARATADEALAADILTLQATTDATMASITALNDVSAASDSPAARAIHQVQLDLVVVEEDVTLTAAAVSAVETRVAQTEDGLAVSGRRFDSLSVSTAEADADADIVSLRAAVDLYNARRDLGEAIAISAQDMRALVVEDRVAIASLETLLAAAINNTAASLKSEQLVRSEADDALAQDIVTIKASLESAEGDIAATATVVSDHATRITSAEGTVTAQGQLINTLQSELDAAETSIAATATVVSDHATRITSAEGTVTAQGQLINTLQSELDAAETSIAATATVVSDHATRITSAEGTVTAQGQLINTLQSELDAAETSIAATATVVSDHATRITSAEGTVTAQGQLINTLQSELDAAETSIAATATVVSDHATRITSAEGTVTAQGQLINTLQSELDAAETSIAASAGAISGLTTWVSDAEGQLTSQATSLTSLTSTVGSQSATIQAQQTSIDGIEAEHALRIDNNGVISGVVIRSDLDNAGVPTTAAVYQVDKFSIIAPGDPSATARSPFVYYSTPQVIDGVTYPPALYSKDAIIQTARVGTLQIAGNAVTVPARVTRPGVVEMTSVSTWEVLASLAMNRKGYATDLSFSATLDGFGSGVLEFGFFRDGVLLNKRHHATAPMGRQTQVSATFTDFDEGTGPTVFQIKGRRATPGVTGGWDANLRVFNRHLAAWQFQR